MTERNEGNSNILTAIAGVAGTVMTTIGVASSTVVGVTGEGANGQHLSALERAFSMSPGLLSAGIGTYLVKYALDRYGQ